MKKTILPGLAGALLTGCLAFIFSGLFNFLELKTLDLRYLLRGHISTDPAILLIDANDSSAQQLGPWPWDRSIHAELIDILKEGQAAVVSYDILFAQPDDAEKDAVLIQSFANNTDVVFPIAVSFSNTVTPGGKSTDSDNYLWENTFTKELADKFLKTGNVIFPLSGLMQKNRLGHIATNRDTDGIVRRVPLIVRHQDKLIPSFAFQSVLNYWKVPNTKINFTGSAIEIPGDQITGANNIEKIVIPVDAKGQMLINYAGPWGQAFKHASFASVLSSKEQSRTKVFEDVEGKFIIVGNTISGSDMKSVPIEKDFPGPGIHANIVNTFLTRNFLREMPLPFDIVLLLLLSLATSRIFFISRNFQKILLLLILASGTLGLGVLLFSLGIIIKLFLPVFSIFVASFVVLIYQVMEEKEASGVLLGKNEKLETLNALIENERDVIAKIQQGLLCDEHPSVPWIKFFTEYQPTSKAGGDYYDFIPIDRDHLGLLISDVSGHGTSAAVIMAMMRALLRSFTPQTHSPSETLQKLNASLRQNLETGHFITAFYGVIHLPTRKMKYASAGHLPPLWVNYDTELVKELRLEKGIPLMILPENNMDEGELELLPNSKLVLYTDGLVEAKNKEGEIFGGQRLVDALLQLGKNLDAESLGRRIKEKVIEFTDNSAFSDDYTVVILEIKSSS